MSNIIEFPGIGIGPFEIDPIVIKNVFWSGRDIAWYGIFVMLGILSGIFYSFWRGKKNNGIVVDDMMDIAIFSIPAAIIGARLYYIIFKPRPDMFKTFYDIIAVWEGGLAVYGGIILGFLAGFLVCKYKKISFLKVFDSAAPAVMLGQIIGRWGNFTNAEAYGIATGLPWGMSINGAEPVHPLFLYEILWNLIGFIIINLIYKKKKFDGQIFLTYISWYGFGRMFTEGIRGNDTLKLGVFRISQIVAFLCFVIGIALFVLLFIKYKNQKLENEAYEGVYTAAKNKLPAEIDADDDKTDEADEPEKAKNAENDAKNE
ncbi:MAG: prolipoprotein diacylglyceryl transferase [Oscillospiraceae bacterium]|nr:prolipoprotein diacylglyceryl transferase [Oscillospiraceae bacterium]